MSWLRFFNGLWTTDLSSWDSLLWLASPGSRTHWVVFPRPPLSLHLLHRYLPTETKENNTIAVRTMTQLKDPCKPSHNQSGTNTYLSSDTHVIRHIYQTRKIVFEHISIFRGESWNYKAQCELRGVWKCETKTKEKMKNKIVKLYTN